MSFIYLPAQSADDWQQFIADRHKQWRSGFSAKATAYSWQDADGFPPEVVTLLKSSADDNLRIVELLLAIPEHKVYFPPMKSHPSQNTLVLFSGQSVGNMKKS